MIEKKCRTYANVVKGDLDGNSEGEKSISNNNKRKDQSAAIIWIIMGTKNNPVGLQLKLQKIKKFSSQNFHMLIGNWYS